MKKTFRSVIALLLAALTVCSLSVVAFAEDQTCPYADEQIYQADENQVFVYTVQVSAGCSRSGAERVRSYMLSKGFDSFLFEVDGGYRIMCGKFPHAEDAWAYCDLIHKKTERDTAYVTDVRLPQDAIDAFAESFRHDPLVAYKVNFRGWENPSGPFIDMALNAEETAPVYAVPYGAGDSFKGAERARDMLIEKGFDAYVVRMPFFYLILAGKFDNKDDATALRDEIRNATDHWDPYVREIQLPKT